LEQIYAKQQQHDRKFEGLTKLMFRIEDSLKAEIATEIAKVMARVRLLEKNVEKQTGDVEKLHQEYFALKESVNRIEKMLGTESRRREKDDSEITTILGRLERIERHLGLATAGSSR